MTQETPAESSSSTGRGRRAPTWFVVAAVLAGLVLVVSAAVAVLSWRYERQQADATPPAGQTTAAQRQSAVSAATTFVTQLNTYDTTATDEYVARVEPLMSDDFAANFVAATQDIFPRLATTGLTSQASVLRAGVSSIDSDSAEVLVAAKAVASSQAGTPPTQQQRIRNFRWEVQLTRDGDRWLVDRYQPFSAVGDGLPSAPGG